MSTKPMRIAYLYQRFSSDQQKGNSSLFRQTEAQDAWLASNPDVVVEDKLVDHGLSGFKGEHLSKGSLGKLVSQIKAGIIPQNALILVEHFSRLSRQNIDKAEELIRTIWSAGITIVTVRCGSEYPPSSINDMATRIKLIVEIESAYKDSKWRSDKYASEGDDLDLILDLMQTSSKKIKALEQRQREIKAKIQCSSIFDISKDIFNLAGKPIELNLALHKLGFKIILKNGTLSYQDKFQLKYMGYDRKNKYYPYKINGEGGFLPSEGLEVAQLLNKTKVLDENTVKVFDGFRDNYVRAVEKIKKGVAITASDIFIHAMTE